MVLRGMMKPVWFREVMVGSQWLRQLRERLRYLAASSFSLRPRATWWREKSL